MQRNYMTENRAGQISVHHVASPHEKMGGGHPAKKADGVAAQRGLQRKRETQTSLPIA